MDNESAKFTNDTDAISSRSTTKSCEKNDLLCPRFYEKELSKLNLHNLSLTNIEEEYGHLHSKKSFIAKPVSSETTFQVPY